MRYLTFLFLVLFSGCSTEKLDPGVDPLGLSYFPLQEGYYWSYEVEESFNNNNVISDTTYRIRYEVLSFSPDRLRANILVSVAASGSEDWDAVATWEAFFNNNTLVVNEGSASFIKLSFPLANGLTWDSNALNSFDEDLYTADSLGQTFSFRDEVYPNTVTIIQEISIDPVQITNDNIRLEVYQRNVGKVYSEEAEIFYRSCGTAFPECCGAGGAQLCFGEISQSYTRYQWLTDTNVE